MSREAAIRFALSTPPDRPGVGRLCQELLAAVCGCPVEVEVPEPVRIRDTAHRARGKRKPWTPERRERFIATMRQRKAERTSDAV